MLHSRATLGLVLVGGLVLAGTGCSASDSPSGPEPDDAPAATLMALVPPGGATGVDRFAPVTVTFDHALMDGMDAYAVLHRGDVTGPEVDGSWSLSVDRRTLTFDPSAPLEASTTYTIHLGGGMMDAEGHHVDLATHGGTHGGQWATDGMMGGMMGGGMPGGAMGEAHMGTGWRHPDNGSYGMVFSFVTGT